MFEIKCPALDKVTQTTNESKGAKRRACIHMDYLNKSLKDFLGIFPW